jgi:hypothetical protein
MSVSSSGYNTAAWLSTGKRIRATISQAMSDPTFLVQSANGQLPVYQQDSHSAGWGEGAPGAGAAWPPAGVLLRGGHSQQTRPRGKIATSRRRPHSCGVRQTALFSATRRDTLPRHRQRSPHCRARSGRLER